MKTADIIQVPFYQVDAFTETTFKGNPAAVCLMPCDLNQNLYQSIAQEMNLSETAFSEQLDQHGHYRLRWFTPIREVSLCGHATLATAHVVFNHKGFKGRKISFQTLSGLLYAEKLSDGIRLDFPRNNPKEVEPPESILKGLGLTSWEEVHCSDANKKLLVRVSTEEQVRNIQPDFKALLAAENTLSWRGVIVTAEGSGGYDFVSRFFAPWMGINEDPVTGSAHTVLAPYWAVRLGKKKMRAYQASERGGELLVELTDNRVFISGKVTTIIEGWIRLNEKLLRVNKVH